MPNNQLSQLPEKKIAGVAPNVFFLGLVSMFNDFSNEMVKSVLPIFLTTTLGASAAFVGFLEGFADALASCLRIISGWWSDRVRKRKSIAVFGYALSVATRWFLAVVSTTGQVLGLRVLDRIGKGVRESPRDALIVESVAPEEIGRSFGFQRSLDAWGSVVGPLAGIALLPLVSGNYKTFFVVASVIGLLALFSFLFVKDPASDRMRTNPKPKLTFSLRGFSREFKMFLLSIFIFSLGFMPVSLLTLKAADTGALAVPIMYAIYTLTFSLAAIPFGKLADRMSKRRLIGSGFVVAILSYGVLMLDVGVVVVGAGFVLLGVYSAMTDGVSRALSSRLLRPEQMASGHGWLQATIGLASLAAGTIGGLIWSNLGIAQSLLYGASMMALGLIIFIYFATRQKAVR